jgi:hypothetical protein
MRSLPKKWRASVVVLLQRGQHHFVAARHVEVDRGLHLAQVGDGAVDGAGQGPAVVDVQRAAAAQHEVDVVVAAEGVAPGQPVQQHGLLLVQETQGLRQHLLVGAEHAVGVDHHLRVAGAAAGQQVFGVGIG